jgi:ABC-2 type transport system permease protein
MLFVMPVIQLVVLANAATFEVKRAELWVVDQDHTELSREVVDRFTGSGRFVAVGRSATAAAGNEALVAGRADVVLVIPARFERDLRRTRHGDLQLVLDAVDGAQAGVIQGYASQILTAYSATLGTAIAPVVRTAGGSGDPAPRPGGGRLEVRSRGWYNTDLDYQRYMVPGILVQLITLVGTLMTALNIVREKEAGTLDQLNVTPISRAAFITAKLVPLWTIALVLLAIGLVIGWLVFGVPVTGSLLLIFGGAGLFLVAALGIGLWISTVAETQQQALFITFALTMVYTLMSGLFTPVHGMPAWARTAAQVNPLLHFIALMRAVMLKGSGVVDVLPHLLALAAAGAIILTIAVRQYRKRAA